MDRKTRRALQKEHERKVAEYLRRPPSDNYANHAKPVTRRDFLAHGLTASMAFLSAPTLLEHLLAETARAEGFACTPKKLWFLVLKSSGGPALSQSFTFVATRPKQNNQVVYPTLAGLEYSGVNVTGGMTAVEGRLSTAYGARMQMTDPFDPNVGNPFWDALREALPQDRVNAITVNAIHSVIRSDNNETFAGILPTILRTYLSLQSQSYLRGGLGVNLGSSPTELRTGLEALTQDLSMESDAMFTRVTSVNSIEQALSAPITMQNVPEGPNSELNINIIRARDAYLERALAKSAPGRRLLARAEEVRSSNRSAQANIRAFTGQFQRLVPATNLSVTTNFVLNTLATYRGFPGDQDLTARHERLANLLGRALAAVRCGVALELITLNLEDGDHHNDTNVRFRSWGRSAGLAINAFICEAHANGADAVVLSQNDGAMYANRTGVEGRTFPQPSGDSDSLATAWLLYAPRTGGQRELRQAEIGFANADGQHSSNHDGGTDINASYILARNALSLAVSGDAKKVFYEIVNPNRFAPEIYDRTAFFA